MNGKILIIDDDHDMVVSLQLLLESHHYTVRTASSGIEGVEIVSSFQPDVIVLDWQMPRMSGIDFLRTLQKTELQRSSYVIMVSGKTTIDDIVTGLDAGADDYLPKPFQPAELLARIRVGLRVKSLEQRITAEAQKSALLQMALSVADSIGNPIAAAKLYAESLSSQIGEMKNPELIKSLEIIKGLLKEALDLMSKYQSITSPNAIPPLPGEPETKKK